MLPYQPVTAKSLRSHASRLNRASRKPQVTRKLGNEVDEFQRVPAVLSVVKRIVDRSGKPGRFLLAGSVSARLLPTGAETLTGRVHRMLLSPLSTAEIMGSDSRLLPTLLSDDVPPPSSPRH
jgi:hypothetical protein